jgi:hypothetical protein
MNELKLENKLLFVLPSVRYERKRMYGKSTSGAAGIPWEDALHREDQRVIGGTN